MCNYIYDGKGSTNAWNLQSQHELELGNQDVDGCRCGEPWHQSVRQVHDNKPHLQDTHGELE